MAHISAAVIRVIAGQSVARLIEEHSGALAYGGMAHVPYPVPCPLVVSAGYRCIHRTVRGRAQRPAASTRPRNANGQRQLRVVRAARCGGRIDECR